MSTEVWEVQYSEMKNSGGCNKFLNGSWIQGFSVNDLTDTGDQLRLWVAQHGTYDGHFGSCNIFGQGKFAPNVTGVSHSCEESSSTIHVDFTVTEKSGVWKGTASNMSCTGSLQCDL